MKKIILLLLITSCTTLAQTKSIRDLISDFKQDSFYEKVYPAKLELENYQEEIIPELIKMLKDTSFVKLTNTADLIYPGASKFYGHGHFIPYNMDYINIRAGWLLEELTFEDFGFKNIEIDDKYFFELIKKDYQKYIEKGSYDLNWKKKTDKEKIEILRQIQIAKVEKWWSEKKRKWTRYNAIKEALSSDNIERVKTVIEFLRYGKTKCNNLNERTFKEEIKPLAIKVKNETKNIEIKEELSLLDNTALRN